MAKVVKVNYPKQVCDKCGITANKLTCLQKYGKPPKKNKFTVSTYHTGICDICKKETSVTEPRDFFYPDFSLLNKRLILDHKIN